MVHHELIAVNGTNNENATMNSALEKETLWRDCALSVPVFLEQVVKSSN
jgi:hypothetical protein